MQTAPKRDGDIRDVERGPMPVAPVKIKEVSHGTLPQPVDDVAKRPAHDQCKTCTLQRVTRPKGHDGKDQGQRSGQRRHQQGLACHDTGQQAEARPLVETEGQVEARNDGNRSPGDSSDRAAAFVS